MLKLARPDVKIIATEPEARAAARRQAVRAAQDPGLDAGLRPRRCSIARSPIASCRSRTPKRIETARALAQQRRHLLSASRAAPRSRPRSRSRAKPRGRLGACSRCCRTPASAISPPRCSKASRTAAIRNLERQPRERSACASSGRRRTTRRRTRAELPDPFQLWRGGELRGGAVAYETWGELNAARDNAILLFTGLSPSAHAASSPADPSAGWWEQMVGPGKALDTDRYFVVCVNSLGSCFGSTGPASIDPATGRAVSARFPGSVGRRHRARRLRSRALARHRAAHRGRWRLARRHGGAGVRGAVPGVARAASISISGSPAASPFAIALRSIQRDAILTRSGLAGRSVRRRACGPRDRHAHRAQARHDHVSLRRRVETPLRRGGPRRRGELARNRPPRDPTFPAASSRSRITSKRRRKVRSRVRSELLSVPVARDGSLRSVRAWRHPAGCVSTRAAAERRSSSASTPTCCSRIDEQARSPTAFEHAGIPTRFVPLRASKGHDAFLVDLPRFDAEIRAFLAAT